MSERASYFRRVRDSFWVVVPAALLGFGLLSPGIVRGHALLTSPKPRDNSDLYKDPNGPCGVGKTTNPSVLTSGSTLTVNWTETVNHPGCFLFDLSTDGDKTWQLLANVKHVATGTTPRPYTAQVQLPGGVTCSNCTFRMRQIMYGTDADPCPPATIPMGATYYSCADVTLQGSGPPPDMASPPAVDAATPPPPPGGGMASGCQMSARHPTSLLPLASVLLPLFVVRSRRRRAVH